MERTPVKNTFATATLEHKSNEMNDIAPEKRPTASAPSSVPALSVQGLCAGYKKSVFSRPTLVVHDLSFSVTPGEVVGFLGPNGAGKSTSIKAIMGFLVPEAGEISVFGHPAGTPIANAKIGYLPEVALYYPFLTPLETLRLYGTLQGLGRKELEEEAMHLLKKVGLEGKERLQLKTFSKGMQQRLGIAQALLGSPDLLVLDEVSSGLDPIGRRHLRELLQEIKESGTTIFFSSHELNEVALLCDRAILIRDGRVVDERTVEDDLRIGTTSALEDYFIRIMESDE
jgi:ABC-2 type transport system ATP-binding protein